MGLKLKQFEKGDAHPQFAVGWYDVGVAEREYAAKLAQNYSKDEWERWCYRHGGANGGYRLRATAWVVLWVEEENEFGPVSP